MTPPAGPRPASEWLSVAAVAERLRVSKSEVLRLAKSERLPSEVTPQGTLRFRASEMDSLIPPAVEPNIDAVSAASMITMALAGESRQILNLLRLRASFDGMVAPALEEWIVPTLTECGVRWQRGLLSVADQHVVTHALSDAIIGLRFHLLGQRIRGTAASVTLGGDEHDMGSRLAQVCLEAAGFHCVLLGRGLPPRELVAWVEENSPELLCCSIPITLSASRANASVAPHSKILLGGAGAPAIRLVPPRVEVLYSLRELEALSVAMMDLRSP
jgi:methanogenic corrinoid protein MtbC1